MTEQWYYARQGEQKVGPVSAAELRQAAAAGKLARSDLVWKQGMVAWAPAEKVKGLVFVDDAATMAPPNVTPPPLRWEREQPPAAPPPPDTLQPTIPVTKVRSALMPLGRNPIRAYERRIQLAALGITLVLLCLPWVRVSLIATPHIPMGVELFTQSGLQGCFGSASPKTQWTEGSLPLPSAQIHGGKMLRLYWLGRALLWIYGLVVLAGVVVQVRNNVVMNSHVGQRRTKHVPRVVRSLLGMPVCSLIAVSVLSLQLFIGFPIEQLLPQLGDMGALARVTYTPWLWLAYLATAVPAGLFAWEWCISRRQTADRAEAMSGKS